MKLALLSKSIRNSKNHDCLLTGISKKDIEDLRRWKNKHKQYFFYQKEISPTQQIEWFENYIKQSDDFMFVVKQRYIKDYVNVGCMGFRILRTEKTIDVYNIMRGRKIQDSSFLMRNAFQLMLSFISDQFDLPISCKVMTHNPAIEWYKKNGFFIQNSATNHVLMRLDKTKLLNLTYKII